MKLDFRAFAKTYHLEVADAGEHHHTHQGWLQSHCPICAGGRSGFHLGFSLERGNFACWRCGGLSTWRVVGAYLGTRDASKIGAAIAAHAAKGSLVARQLEKVRATELRLPPDLGPLTSRHRRYLKNRRFDPEVLEQEWSLRGTRHLSGAWSWRVVAPIVEESGQTIAHVGRSIFDRKPKYKVTDADDCLLSPDRMLYGVHLVEGDAVVVVEGPADAWRLGPGAIAVQGISWKRPQADRLRRFSRRYIMFDSVLKDGGGVDRRARRRAEQLAAYLGMFAGTTELVDGFDCDPGDFSDRRARKIMKQLIGTSWSR